MQEDKKRFIVITGATRGLGRVLAERLAQLGHQVEGTGRNIPEDYPQQPTLNVQKVDVADEGAVKTWAHELISRYGPPDILINNAAVIVPNCNVWELKSDDFRRMLEINVVGTHNVQCAFLTAMLEKQKGIIVNLSSGAGRNGFPGIGGYGATKWAIEGLTKSLAAELPDGMAAIPLSPGVINTDMLQTTWGAAADKQQTPEEWVEKAVSYILNLHKDQSGESLAVP